MVTRRQLVKAMCICWLSITLRFSTLIFLHLWNVKAVGAPRQGLEWLCLQDLSHHSCPIPLTVPPPSTVKRLKPWKYSHFRRLRPSQTSGSLGAMIVPEI
jgi:hypothetical protein